MNYLYVWCNLHDTGKDLEFCRAIEGYLSHLRDKGQIDGYQILRRKLGFGPAELGEFNIVIRAADLERLDRAFAYVAERKHPVEGLHHAVYTAVKDLKTALYRDFPDPGRER